jgi:NAD(P)-dependent dehydrogenase (short-subunit alcohol dehydrogenase family)
MARAGWLDGRVAVCTGGGSGIGRAVVEAFLAHGARVGVLDVDPSKCAGLARMGPRVFARVGDATSAADNEGLVAEALDRWGRIDAAATFVGIFDLYTPLTGIPAGQFDAAFEEIFAINVKSALVTARASLPALQDAKGSLILTLSSSSFYAGRGGALYVASKFALRGVVKQLAHEVAPDVRVNGVAPGGTLDTDLRGLRSLGRFGERLDDRPDRAPQMRQRTPLQVALRPADHAAAYVYLASDQARGLTGEVIRSDGGMGVR